MSDRIINSSLELAIMGLLWQQPHSGYDLLKVFSETAMGGYSNSPGAIYPALKRLARDRSITGEIQNRDTLRPRQVYSLTAVGVETLKQHLRQPVTRDDVMRRADGVMLRFVFAGEVLGRDEAIRVLEQFAREIESYLSDLKRQLAAFPATAAPYGRCALQHGIDMYHAGACWARNAAKELDEQATARSTGRKSHTRGRRILQDGGRK